MESVQPRSSSSATFTLEQFRHQAPRELNTNPYLQRQAARESNARSYPRRIPLALQEAHGLYVRDTQGQLFMDCLAGAGTWHWAITTRWPLPPCARRSIPVCPCTPWT